MKIRSLLVITVLATAILCSGGIVKADNGSLAQCLALPTISCLTNIITQLTQQLTQLQTQQGSTQTWCHTFNANIGVGQKTGNPEISALVTALQRQGLISSVAVFNNGYDETLASAVTAFQEKYTSEVLTPSNLKHGTGYVGVATRRKLNSLYGCLATCTPNWTCGWGSCVNGYQSQVAVDSNNCGVRANTTENTTIACPALARVCTTSACVEEGGTVTGPVSPEYATHCCSGLVAQYPNNGLVGASGICVKPSTNLPPVINGITAPTTLNIGQAGTWTVNASDPENGTLSYSVDWGDTIVTAPISYSASAQNIFVQTTTFTHSYSSTGIYTVTFTVKDNVGLTTQTNSTVHVDNSATTSIIVTSPNGGETWTKGTTQTIRWQDNSPVPNCVSSSGIASPSCIGYTRYYNIYLVPKGCSYPSTCITGPAQMIASSISGNSFVWRIEDSTPGNYYSPGDYKIRVYQSGTSIYDDSDNYFSIVAP